MTVAVGLGDNGSWSVNDGYTSLEVPSQNIAIFATETNLSTQQVQQIEGGIILSFYGGDGEWVWRMAGGGQ